MDAKARICVRQSYYSVPTRYAGRRLEVQLGATMITVYDGPVAAQIQRRFDLGPLSGGAEPQTRCIRWVDAAGRRPGIGSIQC